MLTYQTTIRLWKTCYRDQIYINENDKNTFIWSKIDFKI